jgi:hypothetical protein
LLTGVVLAGALYAVRAPGILLKVLAAAASVAAMFAIDSVRGNSLMLMFGAVAVGFVARLATLRKSVAWLLVAMVVAGSAWTTRFGLPERASARIFQFAKYSRGHVFTSGHSYKSLDETFYADFLGPLYPPKMNAGQMSRYFVRAFANYVAQPLPWDIQSRTELLFMPEQLVWYLLALLFPIGLVYAFRRDALLTCLLAGYSVTYSAAIALNSGNIGTLVRHRALMLPFMVWISAVACVVLFERKGSRQ